MTKRQEITREFLNLELNETFDFQRFLKIDPCLPYRRFHEVLKVFIHLRCAEKIKTTKKTYRWKINTDEFIKNFEYLNPNQIRRVIFLFLFISF